MRTGTPASSRAAAAPFSSPKLGRHRITPPNSPRCLCRNPAYLRPSAGVSIAPYRVAFSSDTITRWPIPSRTLRISRRADAWSDPGKNPRLPKNTANVVLAFS